MTMMKERYCCGQIWIHYGKVVIAYAYNGHRYGEQTNVDDRNPLVRTICVPSTTLHSHNLEILVKTSSTTDISGGETGATDLLVPGLEAQGSVIRFSTITFPVHKTIIYQALQDLDTIPKIGMHKGMFLRIIIDWSWSTLQQPSEDGQSILPINLALGEITINIFRQSL